MGKARKIIDDKNDPTLIPSDSEDEDFVARSDEEGSSSESQRGDDEDERPAKRQKTQSELDTDQIDDLWASFNSAEASSAPTASASASSPSRLPSRKVRVVFKYEFAGEAVLAEKEVDADSDEARQYRLTGQPLPARNASKKPKAGAGPPPTTKTTLSSVDRLFGDEATQTTDSTVLAAPQTEQLTLSVPAVKPKGPGPARGGRGLAAMAASLGGKATKLNTLEKSKMDWNKYVAKEDLGDTLAAARKGGYLDKQDFLQRTEAKKEEDWEKAKSTRRR